MNKVPFALLKETSEYVDVHEVERGTKCDCICPSCKTPLSARKGDVNAWHFAHATRGTSDKTAKDCEFSFYVSVTQMAKQLFSEHEQVCLSVPEYWYLVEDRHPLHKCRIAKEITITPAADIALEDMQIESKIGQQPGDIISSVKGFPLIIGLSHKERPYFYDPNLLDGIRAGIIEIDLTPTRNIFFQQKGGGADTFKDILKTYLFSEIEHKTWLYHPRQESMIDKAREILLQEPLYISAGIAISERAASTKGDFIDRALSGFFSK